MRLDKGGLNFSQTRNAARPKLSEESSVRRSPEIIRCAINLMSEEMAEPKPDADEAGSAIAVP